MCGLDIEKRVTIYGKYKFRYWYEWGNSGGCLWAADDVTREKYGYNPEISNLPLSKNLILFLNETGYMHDKSLNCDYPPDPPDPTIWFPKMEAEFDRRAHEAFDRLCM